MARITQIVVEIPAHLDERLRDELLYRISEATDVWAENQERDWDPFIFSVTADKDEYDFVENPGD